MTPPISNTLNRKIPQGRPFVDSRVRPRPRWLNYAFAVIITVAMLVAREYLAEGIENRPMLILFMTPIILSSFMGGLGPGLTATALAALGTAYFALPPYHSFNIEKAENIFQWCFLILSGVAVSLIGEELQRSHAMLQSKQALTAERASVSPGLVAENRYRLMRSVLTYFLPALVLICVGGYVYTTAEIRLKQQEMRAADQEVVSLGTNTIRATLLRITSDVLFMAKLPRLAVARPRI
jgi:K+-sensing histidine kinase KdpD